MTYFLSLKVNQLCPSRKLTANSHLQAPCTSTSLPSQDKAFALLLAFFISLRTMNTTISWLLQRQLPLTFIIISSVLVRSKSTGHLPYLDCPAFTLKKNCASYASEIFRLLATCSTALPTYVWIVKVFHDTPMACDCKASSSWFNMASPIPSS